MNSRHLLSNLNLEDKTATCSICGNVHIVKGNRKGKKETSRWRCGYKQKMYGRKRRSMGYSAARVMHFSHVDLPQRPNNCDLCGISVEENSNTSMGIDHCHKTGIFRGYLCRTCNLGLAYFKDNPSLLQGAIEYLMRANSNPNPIISRSPHHKWFNRK